jgi:hypothetical protein
MSWRTVLLVGTGLFPSGTKVLYTLRCTIPFLRIQTIEIFSAVFPIRESSAPLPLRAALESKICDVFSAAGCLPRTIM